MELKQLRHFLAVIDTGSLNRAAHLANVSQQGLSASIRAMEQALGATLFERTRSGAKPTVHGQALARHARLILGQHRLAHAEISALSGADIGTAAVGCGAFFARRVMPLAIRLLNSSRPHVNVRVVESSSDVLFGMLVDGELDFAVSTPSGSFEPHPDLAQETLFEDRDMPLVRPSHPLAQRGPVALADLAEFPWLFSARFVGDRERVLRLFAEARVQPPRSMVLTDSPAIILELLSNADYVHVSGQSFFRREFSSEEFASLDVPQFMSRRLGVITSFRQRAMSAASEVLLQKFRVAWTQLNGLRQSG